MHLLRGYHGTYNLIDNTSETAKRVTFVVGLHVLLTRPLLIVTVDKRYCREALDNIDKYQAYCCIAISKTVDCCEDISDIDVGRGCMLLG
jgi:hypothetical protein